MCGIFGVITSKESEYSPNFLKESIKILGNTSQSRGQDSSGLCILNQTNSEIDVLKGPIPISELLETKEVKRQLENGFTDGPNSKYAFGHARLVTNGTQLNDNNNQPVVNNNIIGVHNGIIVNVDDLWRLNPDIERKYEIDTEVLFALISESLFTYNKSLEFATSSAINSVFGTVATAFSVSNINKFVLATNNGSLYTIQKENDILFFASELAILTIFGGRINLRKKIGEYRIQQVSPGNGLIIDLEDLTINVFSFHGEQKSIEEKYFNKKRNVNIYTINPKNHQLSTVMDLNLIHLNKHAEKERSILRYPVEQIKSLTRCTKCILPETFPFIQFDDNGICNYCHNYKNQKKSSSLDDLKQLVNPYRNHSGKPDVLVPYSGGRDSTYVLHVVKEELGLNPIAFTYDWGMVTDLARRNIARICGKLGIEHIIVAADIHWKRENIKKNIKAWLNNPELGMIPLFMAGDKYFFYYAHKIKKQLNIDLEIWGINNLENTDFKTGFSGLKPQNDKQRIYSLSSMNKLKLFGYVTRNWLSSPGYINQSILDTIGSFLSRYYTPKDHYYHLYDYIQWHEDKIERTIIDNYDWEKAVDTDSTWRIGDGTASFYNYIYTLVAGFCENDTFRSNQIREGMITREQALKTIYQDNKPRYNSIKWYLEIIGLDYYSTISKINEIKILF